MPGSSLLSALPLGLLMFAGTAAVLLRKKWGAQRAALDFPALAASLGLQHAAPRHAKGAGVLSGTYQGRTVRIDADEQRLLKVRFHGAPRVDLRSYQHSIGVPFDMVTIYSRDRDFDRFFRTRHAAAPIAERIVASEQPGRLVSAFEGQHARPLQSLTVTSDGVVVRFEYISAEAVRELLSACVALADLIEPSQPAEGATAEAQPEAPASEG
jgi:hypothetical protein